MECEYCKNTFSNKYNLSNHQKRAKFCLEIQKSKNNYFVSDLINCKYCNQSSTPEHLKRHLSTCKKKKEFDLIKKSKEQDSLHEKTQGELEYYKNRCEDLQEEMNDLLKEIALSALGCNNAKIESLTKKYVKKQKRVDYKERNVIYILTTELMKKERRYIMGKAVNLTNRLSTYNKSDEHEVIFYISCDDEDRMNVVENLVFQKLKEFREQANRERFILPIDKNIEYFIDILKNCVDFV
tara:strand:- start:466 stop:1182 length:717 start_codon:yes stop_codon:yes gene_type:complete